MAALIAETALAPELEPTLEAVLLVPARTWTQLMRTWADGDAPGALDVPSALATEAVVAAPTASEVAAPGALPEPGVMLVPVALVTEVAEADASAAKVLAPVPLTLEEAGAAAAALTVVAESNTSLSRTTEAWG